ncbi:pyridoxal-phosphate dependent enzyme [Pseudomonas aeruginosa]|nr:pyridoxal-phosphate dependent enzyme [Pseudomonas aeruginosa]
MVAFSSGNHAQAIALSARLLGIPATIVMPADAPAVKIEATRGYGGQVVLCMTAIRKIASRSAATWRSAMA